MPYKREGRKVFHKVNGRWKVKQVATSVEKAESTIRLLRAIEHGMKPRKRK